MSWPGGILTPLMFDLATTLSAPKVKAECRNPASVRNSESTQERRRGRSSAEKREREQDSRYPGSPSASPPLGAAACQGQQGAAENAPLYKASSARHVSWWLMAGRTALMEVAVDEEVQLVGRNRHRTASFFGGHAARHSVPRLQR